MERQIPFSPPDIGETEIRNVVEVLRSGWITTGPKTKQFEQELSRFMHTERTVCLNSATAALELTLRVLGIGPGDEVITSAYTYTASASVVCHVGAKLVLVDVGPGSYEMDYDRLEAAITERTKAVIPVDLAGVPCDYDRLYEIVERKKALFRPATPLQRAIGRVAVVADCAHALGASRNGRCAGGLADFSSFSFHAVKNLTTAEGGAVTWRSIPGVSDEDIYRQYMLLSLHGQSKDALQKTQVGQWEYDIVTTGYKCNMTDIMAAIGLGQLERYPILLARRRELTALYDRCLEGQPLQILKHSGPDFESSHHLYLIRVDGFGETERNALITAMAQRGITTNVHYKPLPMHTAYRKLGFDIADYPASYEMYRNEITLPLHTRLTDEDVIAVSDTLKALLSSDR